METQEVLPQKAQKEAQIVIDKIKELTFKVQHQSRLKFGKLFKELQDIYSKHGVGCFDKTIASLGFSKTTCWRWIGEYEASTRSFQVEPLGDNPWRWNVPDFATFRRATGFAGQYPKKGTQVGNFKIGYTIANGWSEDCHCRPPIVPFITRLEPQHKGYMENGNEVFAAALLAHPPKPTEYEKAEARTAKFIDRAYKLFKDDLEAFDQAVLVVRQRLIGGTTPEPSTTQVEAALDAFAADDQRVI